MTKTTQRSVTTKTAVVRIKGRNKRRRVSAALVNKICDEIAKGITLTEICARPGMPSVSLFYKVVNQSSSLRERLARARVDAAELLADELLAIADNGSNDTMTRVKGGQKVEVLNNENVRRAEIRIATRQWLLAKMAPARWGGSHCRPGHGRQ